jgi:hypothetical protein
MQNELDALRDATSRLDQAGVEYMLTGSVAMAFYAEPRFTNDIDLVIALGSAQAERFITAFREGYYLPEEAIPDEIRKRGMFNLIHEATRFKLDCIILKDDELEHLKFSRRIAFPLQGISVKVISREDLILSKLSWARESKSPMQQRDIHRLAEGPLDLPYLETWIAKLNLQPLWNQWKP